MTEPVHQTTKTKPGRARLLLAVVVNALVDRVFAGKLPAPCPACGGQGCKTCAWLGSEFPDES